MTSRWYPLTMRAYHGHGCGKRSSDALKPHPHPQQCPKLRVCCCGPGGALVSIPTVHSNMPTGKLQTYPSKTTNLQTLSSLAKQSRMPEACAVPWFLHQSVPQLSLSRTMSVPRTSPPTSPQRKQTHLLHQDIFDTIVPGKLCTEFAENLTERHGQ